jgi:electron transfer flavoprotein beta subunit
MRILTPFKAVPEPYSGFSGSSVAADAKWMINPFDAIAIEEALRIRERGEATVITAVTIGPARADEQVRTALAMGVDHAIRIDEDRPLDASAIASLLRAIVKREVPDLILMGKQAVDDDANQTGQMLAGMLQVPQATFVSRISLSDDRLHARCTRETDTGLQLVTVRLPAVITADLRLNEPRYVSMPGLLKARRRPIEVISTSSLEVSIRPRTVQVRLEAPPHRMPGRTLENVEQLVNCLRHEARVL